MPLVTNKCKKSLRNLAALRNIPKKRWMTELSEWLGIERTTVSTWCRSERNNIPEKHIRNIESRGYPREQWYIEEEIREKFTLGDQVTAEVTRGGVIVPEDPYKPGKEDENEDMLTPTKEMLAKYPALKHLLQYAADDDEEGFTACIELEHKKRSARAGEAEDVRKRSR